METFLSFLIAVAATVFFVRRYLKGLGQGNEAPAAPPAPGKTCARCAAVAAAGAEFCPRCGAPLTLWAAAPAATAGGNGKPRPVINASLCIGCGSCVDACPEDGTLAVVNGKAILVQPERCLGHARCVDACPTQGITLSAGGARQTLRVPRVEQNFETNVAGIYIVGELGGLGLIKTAINEGKLVIDHLRSRLAEKADGAAYDVIIVGAGPAGLSAALAAHQYGLRYIALEQGETAATIRHYPRRKLVFAEPIQMPLYGNLYMADGSKESLLAIWETIIANTGVRIETNTRVEGIRRDGGRFAVQTPRGEYLSRAVVLALGKRGSPRRLGVPGEERAKVAYRLIEAESYAGEDILVVGGGDSAVECALALVIHGRNRVTLSYRGGGFHRLKERNQAALGAAEVEGRVRVLRKSNVIEIGERSVVLDQDGAPIELPNSYVFILIGGEPPDALLRKIGIEIVEKTI